MGLAGLSIAMFGASANAEVESEFNLGYHTDYIFRGFDMGEDLFDFGLDFAGSCDCGFDWSAGFWYGSYDTMALADNDEELDLYAGISKDLGFGSLELGFIRYLFPDDVTLGSDATEIYLSYSTEFNVVELNGTFYYVVQSEQFSDLVGDWYLDLSATYGFEVAEGLSGEFGVGVAFFNDDSVGGQDGLANYSAHLSLTKQVSDDISVSPYVAVVFNDDDYNPDLGGSGEDYVYGGIRTTFNF